MLTFNDDNYQILTLYVVPAKSSRVNACVCILKFRTQAIRPRDQLDKSITAMPHFYYIKCVFFASFPEQGFSKHTHLPKWKVAAT